MEEKIYKFAQEDNIIIGIGTAQDFEYMRDILENKFVPFVEKDIEKRISPQLIMPNVKSIIAIGIGYNKKIEIKKDEICRANVSIAAIGEDYHNIVKSKLENIRDTLLKDTLFESMIFCDTGSLIDREVAKRCGLGWSGKHSSIINEKLGSMFFIGYMLTNLNLKPNKPYKNNYSECGDCNACIKACPNNAISKNGCDYTKCISYLTQTKELSQDQYQKIGTQIYGCDICQKVCPFNKDKEIEVITDIEQLMPDIYKLLSMSNKEFNQRYKQTAAGWRGKKILQRNAIISLGNKKNKVAFELLQKFKNDERKEIIQAISWALKNNIDL